MTRSRTPLSPRRTPRLRRTRAVLALLVGSIVLSGCDFDVYKLPLPGGTDTGDDAITVTVQFNDVLDLVPQSSVKVADVSVGKVTDVDLDGYTAEVTVELRKDVELPDDAVATIRQTSLLGEKFVSLSAPAGGGSDQLLADGDVIGLDRSGRNPEVEEVLGALSLILNGGGVAQLKTITQELNLALTGREDSARSVLTQIESLTGTLDDNKGDIVNAIEALNRLSVAAQRQQPIINSALDELPSALASIDQQRQDLVRMLEALSDLGDVGVRVIKASKQGTIDSLELLQPVLTELSNSGDAFVDAFNVFLTYPFVDEVVGRDPQVARNLAVGDYTNLSATLEIDLTKILNPELLTDLPIDLPLAVVDAVTACINHVAGGGMLTDAICTRLLGTSVLTDFCQQIENRDRAICGLISLIPGLPSLPGLGGAAPGGTAAGGNGGATGGAGANPGPLPGLGGVLGGLGGLLNRTGTGFETTVEGDPTMGQLMNAYDPDLVSLLVPAMVVGGS